MEERRRNAVERFLGLFAQVRGGEGAGVLLLALNVLLLLTAYYIVKPVREALILVGSGAEVKSYASAGQALLLLGAVPLYGRLATHLPRRRLITIVTLFFALCLALFYLLAHLRVPLGVVFYLWVGIFNLMVIAQFWAFANDVYTKEEGERLFPIVAFGGSVGAVGGSSLAGLLIKPLGVYQLLLVAGGLLLLSLAVTVWIDTRERDRLARRPRERQLPAPEAPIGRGGAFKLVVTSRYLLLIALMILLLNWVNTTGEYILGKTVLAAAADAVASGAAGALTEAQLIGRFYSGFYAVVNGVALLAQLFLVSRIIRYAGVKLSLLVMPAIALGGYAVLAFFPVLAVVRWAKTAENATDYSLQNTVRQALFLPTTRQEKYKAKQAIDAFFQRAGDVMSAALVYVGATWLALQPRQFALVNMVLVAVWLALAVLVGRRYGAMEPPRTEEVLVAAGERA